MLFVFVGVGGGVIPLIFAELRGGNTGDLFEGAVKCLRACKAAFVTNFVYGHIGGEQELFCLVYPQKRYVLMKSCSERVFNGQGYCAWVHMKIISQIIYGEIGICVVIFNVFNDRGVDI